jgi:orotate phosphoribosyltransferase-like protein
MSLDILSQAIDDSPSGIKRAIIELKERGLTTSEIASSLNDHGVKNRDGKSYSKDNVRKIIMRAKTKPAQELDVSVLPLVLSSVALAISLIAILVASLSK